MVSGKKERKKLPSLSILIDDPAGDRAQNLLIRLAIGPQGQICKERRTIIFRALIFVLASHFLNTYLKNLYSRWLGFFLLRDACGVPHIIKSVAWWLFEKVVSSGQEKKC